MFSNEMTRRKEMIDRKVEHALNLFTTMEEEIIQQKTTSYIKGFITSTSIDIILFAIYYFSNK